MYPRANTCWLQMYSEAAQEAVLLHLTFPKASLCWLCPISASYWEPITNDSCSLVFFSQLHTCIINSIVNVVAFSLLHIVFFVNVPPAFDKHTASPVHCVLTLRWQGKVWHVDSETFPRHHWWTHVCVVQLHSANDGLLSILLCKLILKVVWAESNDPLWQPSHAAATSLIFTEMPAVWRAASSPTERHSQRVSLTLT